ncbi:MAG: TetR/AcrR family transcriptional regulator [Actinomycetota bacterium]|nr:TetR/AcrR family transcriptional regulator [Actinomycetota bacterium]
MADQEVEDRILDAAARCLHSMRSGRAPIAELARQAGVSRPTVYRRFADGDAIVRALWEREIGRLVADTSRNGDTREALVAQIVAVAERVSTHETLAPTFTTDQTLITRYIVDQLGAAQRALLEMLRSGITAAQAGGTVRRGNPGELAAMTLLIAQSAVQSRRMVDAHLPERAWRRELTHALNGYLQP